MPQMVIANRLDDGRVVFLAGDGQWVTDINAGQVAETATAAEDLLGEAQAAEAANHVVEASLIDVTRDPRLGLRPTAWREVIRANGPTVHTERLRTAPAPR